MEDRAAKQRRSLRLRYFDYAGPAWYFVTICTANRACLFGEVREGAMHKNGLGGLVAEEWVSSAKLRREIELDQFVVMPNHFHAIVEFRPQMPPWVGGRTAVRPYGPAVSISTTGAHGRAPLRLARQRQSLGSLVAGFKAASARRVNLRRGTPGASVWQRNYFEHVIRDEEELTLILKYIDGNPAAWPVDRENPAAGEAPTRLPRRQRETWQV